MKDTFKKNIRRLVHCHCLEQLLNCITSASEKKLCLVDFGTLDMGKLVLPVGL